MPRIDVPFTVTEQVLRQYPPTLLRAGDRNYFYATFDVCEKWADVADLRAVFERGDLERPYVQDLVQDNGCYECVIPWEVMQTPGIVRVGIFGGDRILTNKVDLPVSVGCACDGDAPRSPTRDWFLRVEELIEELSTPDPEAIAAAVADYIAANPIEEKDPTVPAWAKTEEKPTYTADEVGAIAETELQTAIDTALAQAKASGAFDGADGQDGADGAPGKDGADGQPGENGVDGYSPTAKVTQNDNGATITITDKNGTTTATVTNGKDGADGNPGADGSPGADGADGKSAYQYAQEGGYTGTETEFAAKLAQDMPTTLPNPNALTFTGAVTGSYDGSEAVTVDIPSGGGGGITGFRRVVDTTLTEAAEIVNLTTDINGNTFSLSECYLFIDAACTEAAAIVYIPNGYWAAGTYLISSSKTATDYPYGFAVYACGGSDHFFGFELKHRTGTSMAFYNSNNSAHWKPITSYKLSGKFAAGARFIIFGRDA